MFDMIFSEKGYLVKTFRGSEPVELLVPREVDGKLIEPLELLAKLAAEGAMIKTRRGRSLRANDLRLEQAVVKKDPGLSRENPHEYRWTIFGKAVDQCVGRSE